MDKKKLKETTFIGIVEDNNDPKHLGRVKVRVANIYENIPVEDIPYSSPWKDLNGNEFNIPEVGKAVTIVFDDGDIYKPQYIYSEHYNINLETKLKQLSDSSYSSMKGIMFDQKTQIYSNDDEGLVIDYKYNNININNSEINLNLKDNYSYLKLGDENANQQVILGTNFMNWFDELVKNLAGENQGPYIGNMGAPVQPNPSLINVLNKYKQLRDPNFLSNNVFVVNNNRISTVINKGRVMIDQNGDSISKTGSDQPNSSNANSGDFGPSYDLNNDANISNDSSNNTNTKTTITNDQILKTVTDITNQYSNIIISDFSKRLVVVAQTQIGVQETPANSNSGPQVIVYQNSTSLKGTGFPWCAAFVCWCFTQAANGVSYSFKLPKTASAYAFENWATINSSNGVRLIKPPFTNIIPGDIIIFNFSHIGISNGVLNNGVVPTIEGNTSGTDASLQIERNGGGVYKKSRKVSLIRSIIRIS